MAKDTAIGPVSKPEGGYYESSEEIRAREAEMMEVPPVDPAYLELEAQLNEMTIKQLVALAAERSIKGRFKMKKEKLIGILLLSDSLKAVVPAPISPAGEVPVVVNPDAPSFPMQSARVKRIATNN